MFFREKFDRARALQKEQMPDAPDPENGPDEKEQPDLSSELERGDIFAMLASGCAVIWLPCLLALLAIIGAGWLFLQLFH